MNISLATLDDIPDLCRLLGYLFELEAEFTPEIQLQQRGLKAIIESPQSGTILVSREQGRPVGMVSLLYSISTALGGRVCTLEDMVVEPDKRGSAIGSELLSHAIDYAREQGVKRITLLTDHDNAAAQQFYQRQGFVLSPMVAMRTMIT
ncbi:GNAT family N-acetyltransferase [Amphritea sp.]|uniref:GNAT family N-acetyltransferase n=1 Tax=Amphritea sp. TaxID=1872502 RepID=UPI003D0EF9F3